MCIYILYICVLLRWEEEAELRKELKSAHAKISQLEQQISLNTESALQQHRSCSSGASFSAPTDTNDHSTLCDTKPPPAHTSTQAASCGSSTSSARYISTDDKSRASRTQQLHSGGGAAERGSLVGGAERGSFESDDKPRPSRTQQLDSTLVATKPSVPMLRLPNVPVLQLPNGSAHAQPSGRNT